MPMTAEEERASWQYRALAYLHGNTTALGAALLSAIGKRPKRAPYFVSAHVSPERVLMLTLQPRNGPVQFGLPGGPLLLFVRELASLAEKLKFNDADTTDLLETFRAWLHLPRDAFEIILKEV